MKSVFRLPASLILLRTLGLLALLHISGGAHATIGPGHANPAPNGVKYANGKAVAGNGELFFTIQDDAAKLSYTLDLGFDMDSFWVNAQQDGGMQWFKPVDDANWESFLGQVDKRNLLWAVAGIDNMGGTAAGQQRLFSTVKQGAEGSFRNYTNLQFTLAVGATKAGTFLSLVNDTGSHNQLGNNYDYNGSSVNASSDNSRAYFGGELFGPNLGGTNTCPGCENVRIANEVGKSSWFYYVTRSGPVQGNKVTIDEFDNLGYDAYWGFTYVDATENPNSPYKGKYLLSYTLEKAGVSAATAEGRLRMSLTDYLASAVPMRRVASVSAGEFAGYRPGSLVVLPTSPVPEPSSWALMGLGLAALAVARRHRAGGSPTFHQATV